MSHLTPAVSATDHHQGPLDGGLVLVEYGDFECSYCGAAYPQVKAVQRELGAALCLVFRHFPLKDAHPHAERAAEFAEAAATVGRFWEMHDWLYEHQSSLEDASLIRAAQHFGLDPALIEATLAGQYGARVGQSFRGGVRSGVNGTPCFFINGTRHDGPWDAAALLEALGRVR
ncbi:MAG: DsbA family protein [Steroidobacteraceae bacterium]|jgi:protein-disulfide isomerase